MLKLIMYITIVLNTIQIIMGHSIIFYGLDKLIYKNVTLIKKLFVASLPFRRRGTSLIGLIWIKQFHSPIQIAEEHICYLQFSAEIMLRFCRAIMLYIFLLLSTTVGGVI